MMMKDENVYLEQAGLKSLGFDPGVLDGDEGPKTLAAKAAWRGSLDSAAAAARPGEIATRMVALAQGELAVRETSPNQGAGIRKYWTATSYDKGYDCREPYCAAFVCWLVAMAVSATGAAAKHAFGLPQSPVAFDFLAWAKANAGKGVELVDAQGGAALLPGDVVVFTFSHVGVVEKASAAGSGVATIEANTDPDSTDGEGGGVYRRSRGRGAMKGVVRILG